VYDRYRDTGFRRKELLLAEKYKALKTLHVAKGKLSESAQALFDGMPKVSETTVCHTRGSRWFASHALIQCASA
jgi:hypothetical protein